MIPVPQTLFRPSEGDGAGNCLAAALASVLEVPIADVPNFAAIPTGPEDEIGRAPWFRETERWIGSRGLALASFNVADGPWPYVTPGTHLLAHGMSPRGAFFHTVVIQARAAPSIPGRLEFVWSHDPHPSGDFLGSAPIEEAWLVVRP